MERKIFRAFVTIILLGTTLSFPVSELQLSTSTWQQLSDTSTSQAFKNSLATSQILPHLRIFFNSSAHAIQVDVGDVTVSNSYPDQTVDDSCHHQVTAHNPSGTARILNGTRLMFGTSKISWKSVSVFADGRLNSQLNVQSDVTVRIGKKIFGHHCTQVARKTLSIDVLSHGQVGFGLNFTASNAHIAKAVNGSGYELVFNFECDSVALVLNWNIDEVTRIP